MRQITRAAKSEAQREFVKLFDSMCGKHGRYEVWQDFVIMAAIEISNAFDSHHREARNKIYTARAKKYMQSDLEKFASMLGHIVSGMEANPDQDFLGDLYMSLELGSSKAGQFFTPYGLCQATARMIGNGIQDKVAQQGWVSVNDPACGAGALLVAFANYCREQDVNYQNHVLFAAQDIDYTVACMCYIQLSFLGCPGYVVVGNTLTHPTVSACGDPLFPLEQEGRDIWYTPMFFSDVWILRRKWHQVDMFFKNASSGSAGAVATPQDCQKDDPKPQTSPEKKSEKPKISAQDGYKATEYGQLTLF